MTKHRVTGFLLAILAVFVLASPVSAQTGSVRGQVVDETDAVIPGAKVTLVPDNGRQRSVTAGANGDFNFTNEIGHGGTVRLLKNLVGLWIVQECRREWARQGQEFDYATLMSLAGAAPAFVSLINPDDPRFLAPGDMPAKIAAYCRETRQPVPASPGAIVRCEPSASTADFVRFRGRHYHQVLKAKFGLTDR